ncbi:MAG: hypothetical protein C4581_00735 [Nitrospiraceae bacterium]|nr:MAG: hypothetical protein C4581_00735 [Nitrospiraceae bacterium]
MVKRTHIRGKIMIDREPRGEYGRFQLYGLSVICFLILFSGGCSSSTLKQYKRPDYDIKTVKTVAVLPFRNLTSDNYADEKVRSKVSIELLSRDVNIIEPGEIISVLRELKIKSVDSIRNKDMVSIGSMLKVDAVLTGSVEAFGISRGITASYPEVTVHLIMFDTITGHIVWSNSHTSGGASFWTRHFGAEGSTLDNVSERVVEEAFDALYGR